MSPVPSHEELHEMLPAAALEILEPTQMELVAAHRRECAECDALLRDYREVAASLALQLPLQQLDPARDRAVRARLAARAGSLRGPGTRAPGRPSGYDRWIGWAVAAGLAGILMVHHSVHRSVNYGWLVAGVLMLVLLGVGLYARTQQRRASELRKEVEREKSR
ncbi:MAG TPA: hypothetical protein VF252_06765 [Gemmatimonadales bacterium]